MNQKGRPAAGQALTGRIALLIRPDAAAMAACEAAFAPGALQRL